MKSTVKRTALYARVSTDSQTTANQLREPCATAKRHGWVIVAEFVDHGISGAKGRDKRPQFDALLRGVARKQFDMIAAWSVDRLGRSLQDLVQMCGVFAHDAERGIVGRVNAGLARARSKGVILGRPKTDPKIEQRIRDRAATGMGKLKIARTLGVGVSVVQRVLA